MRSLFYLSMAAVFVFSPLTVDAQDSQGETTATAFVGARVTDVDGSADRAAEYITTDEGPVLGVDLATFQDWGSLFVNFDHVDSSDQEGDLTFDIQRMVRSHTSYNALYHRLGHESMEHLEATSFNGKVTIHTDFSPLQDYNLTYSDLDHRTEIQFPHLRWLNLAVEYRRQERDGHRQAFTTSHCDTCHTKSQAHHIDERTSDGTLEASVAWGGGSVTASVTSRELRQGSPFVNVTFDNALHPELQLPLFDNRLQFDDDIGNTVADLWPDIKKDSSRLTFDLANVAGFAVNAGGVWSQTENSYTGLESDYSGYVVNLARRLGEKARLRWRGRVYSISNDDVFVDTIERVTVAGPHAGQTYEDIYGQTFDFVRRSALDRDAFESRLDLSYRINREIGTFRFLWDYETIDRENYQVAPGETDTTTNRVGLTWRSRFAKGFRADAQLYYGDVDNPFMLLDGACSTLVSQSYPNPWSPETPQYVNFHEARIADTTASPASWTEFKAGLGYTRGKTTISGTYRFWDGDNDSLDLTDWSRQNQTATVTLWTAPQESWEWFLAYAWQDSQLDAPVCIPVFDG
jgi:hypothetical protein